MRFLFRVLVAGILAGASAFLAATSTAEHQAWRIAAACITALPAAFITGAGVANRFRPSDVARSSIAVLLRRAILDLGEEKIGDELVFRDVVAGMSFHVWLVPVWYRRLYRVRQRACRGLWRLIDSQRLRKVSGRPTLDRFVVDRVDDLEPSGISFKKGVGLVGICIARDKRDKALIVDFETPDMQALLSSTEEEWSNAPVEYTHNLKHEDFAKLADKYGQAAAFVLREKTNGEAIGCLTVELPPDSRIPIQDYGAPRTPSGEVALTAEGAILIRKLKSTRNIVQGIVSIERITR